VKDQHKVEEQSRDSEVQLGEGVRGDPLVKMFLSRLLVSSIQRNTDPPQALSGRDKVEAELQVFVGVAASRVASVLAGSQNWHCSFGEPLLLLLLRLRIASVVSIGAKAAKASKGQDESF
jgi:hypothetical protein